MLVVVIGESSPTSNRLVETVKIGGWLTGVTSTVKLLVAERLPSEATNWMTPVPLALVTGVRVTVKTMLDTLATLVPVTTAPARLVFNEVGTRVRLVDWS